MVEREEIMKEKVYCKDCKYFRFLIDLDNQCEHPNNIYPVDDYYSRKYYYRKLPKKLNKRNNCKWYERKARMKNFHEI
jgi:hypothetical protein